MKDRVNSLAKELYGVAFPFHSEGFTENFRRLAKYVIKIQLVTRLEEHRNKCLSCRSEVMMEDGLSRCVRQKELLKEMEELESAVAESE